jgi:hypothetical protein
MLRWLSLGLAAACCLVLFRLGVTAPRHLTLNANEGWNAYHAAGVIAGQPLYPSPPGLFPTNYPPLSFFIVAALGQLMGGDMMLAGRMLSLLSFVIWALALALTAVRLGCTRDEAAFSAVLFSVNMLVFADYYVAVNDPQLLAHAVAAFAPFILLREPRTNGTLFGCALLFASGIFVKHNLVAIPLGCIAWLLRVDRPAGWRLMGFGALLGIAGLGACIALFGPGFLEHLLWPRSSSLGKAWTMTRQWMPLALIPVVVLPMLIRQAPGDRQVLFGVVLAASAVLVGVASLYKAGVYWNATFDAVWALSLTAALALDRLPSAGRLTGGRLRAVLVAAYLIVPAAVIARSASIHWASPRFWLDPRWSEADSSAREIEFLAAHPGPALCENLALCYWAGKPAEVDFFNAGERIGLDPRSADALVRLLDAHRFRVAQIDGDHDLGPRVAEAITRNYTVDHTGRWGSLLVPR